MTYIDKITEELEHQIKLRFPDEEMDPILLRHYANVVMSLGTWAWAEDAHNAWALWRTETKPDHHNIVPFGNLTPEEKALDEPFRDAIVETAKKLGY